MSLTSNIHGKTPYMCSCGIPVNLEEHEKVDWLSRHGAHYSGQSHEIKQIGPVHQPDTVQGMIMALFNALKLQSEDQKDQLKLMIQREIANALPNKEVKK